MNAYISGSGNEHTVVIKGLRQGWMPELGRTDEFALTLDELDALMQLLASKRTELVAAIRKHIETLQRKVEK